MSELQPAGAPWDDLLAALTLLRREAGEGGYPFHCEHDELQVLVDPARFTADELAQLDEWGFFVSDDGFKSFRFGSA